MAEDEAEAESAEEEDGKKKGGIKGMIIKIVPLLIVGYFGAKMTVLKPPPPTQDELDAQRKTELLEIWTTCAHENEQPFNEDEAEAAIEAIIKEENILHGHGEDHEEEDPNEDSEHSEEDSGDEEHSEEEPAAEGEDHGKIIDGMRAGGLGLKVVSVRPATGGGGGATSEMKPIYENDAVTLNLADGHYVKVLVALQLSEAQDVEALGVANYGSKAQDIVNSRLRALTVEQLQAADAITALKYELGNTICREYEGEVSSIYFVEFVTQ